jgi:MFS family permease
VLLVLGMSGVVIGLQQGPQWGWTAPATLLALIGGPDILLVFALTQLRTKSPLLALALFRIRDFRADLGVLGCTNFALAGQTVFAAGYLQRALGFSPFVAGLGLLPLVIPGALMTLPAGRLFDRVGVKVPVVLGTGLLAAALLVQTLVMPSLHYGWLAAALVVAGIGIAFIMSATNTDAVSRAPLGERGQASGLARTSQEVGSAVGLAAISAVVGMLELRQVADLAARVGSPVAEEASRALAAHDIRTTVAQLMPGDPQALAVAQEIVARSIAGGFALAAAVMVVALVLAIRQMTPGRQRQ